MRLRVGVIGLGMIWQERHKPALLGPLGDRFQIVAVCSRREAVAKAEAEELGCAYTTDWRELLARSDLDVVHLHTPTGVRLPIIREVARRGLPLYCQKPLALDLDEAREIRRVVRESGIVFATEFVRRFFPISARLKQLLATRLGQPRLILAENHGEGIGGVGHWMRDQKLGGGYMLDYGVHIVDACRWLFGGEGRAVTSFGGRYNALQHPANDVETLAVEFGGDRAAQLVVSRALAGDWRGPVDLARPDLVVYAEGGVVAFDPLHGRLAWNDADGGGSLEEKLPGESQWVAIGATLNENFYRYVVEGVPVEAGIEDAYRATELVLLGTQSRREGRRIEVPD